MMASTTVNFTAAIDRDLLKRAKIVAAKNETSVNTLLNNQLRYLVENFETGETSHNGDFAILLAFSLGHLDERTAMQNLGIDSEEDLFLLMAQAHLPMPRLPDAKTNTALSRSSICKWWRLLIFFCRRKVGVPQQADIERSAIQNGRHFSPIRFP